MVCENDGKNGRRWIVTKEVIWNRTHWWKKKALTTSRGDEAQRNWITKNARRNEED